MIALQRKQLAWIIATGVTLGGSAAFGWLQGRRDLQANAATIEAHRSPAPKPLALAQPPNLQPTKEDPANAVPQAPAAGQKPAMPPPGGFPVDVLLEMWETSLQTPHPISATPLTAENWFITGVVMRGKVQQVIVQRGTDPKPHFHKVGDLLPGGVRIAWVRPNAIGLITPKKEKIALPLGR